MTSGCSARYRTWSRGKWGAWIGGSVSQRFNSVALTRPVQSGIISSGWRMPTGWAVLAGRTTYRDFDYECLRNGTARYNFQGHGSDPAHGLPKLGGVTVSGGNMTVNIDFFVEQRCRAQARSKINDAKVDLAVTVAEFGKTVDLLADTVSKLCRLYDAVRRYDWKRAYRIAAEVQRNRTYAYARKSAAAYGKYQGRKLPRRVANHWLEYQYGWLPLFSDLYGLQELLKSKLKEDDLHFKVVSAVTDEYSSSEFFAEPNTEASFSLEGSKFEQFIKVVYHLKIRSPMIHGAGYGVTNPLAVAWELVPFSFVVDWLMPIGQFLENLTVAQGTAFVSGYEDRIISGTLNVASTRYVQLSGVPCSFTYDQFAFERRTKGGLDFPIPYIRSPWSKARVASALSLLSKMR